MGHRNFFQSIIGLALITSFVVGCGTPERMPEATSGATPAPSTATHTATVEPTRTAAPAPQPEHRIGVRVVNGVGEFYDRLTQEKFIPRGNNYIRLAPQTGFSGETFVYHSTFNVGLYDPKLAEEALRRMHADGYNIVRVFVQGNCKTGCIGDPAGGLSEAYIANVADFLRKARAYNIFVIFTTDAEPATKYYVSLLDTTWSENFGGTNSNYLRGGGILVAQQFWQDFIGALLEQGAPLDAVFAYELRNELFFETNAAPFTLTSGTVSTANGKTYDMASGADRQRMMDENLVLWIDKIRAAILERDPTALVTVGFFVPHGPNPARVGDERVSVTAPAIWESKADFIDLHPYPGFELNLKQYVENFGMEGMQEKPIIMGELGAARSSYPAAATAARALHDWQVDSCQYGFDGWLLWTWDTEEQPDFYNGLTGQGEIDQVLAPANRPDPCKAGTFKFFEYNIALGMPARASRSLPDQPPSAAVDGSTSHWWGAGSFAPQWILIDLGKPSEIGSIRLAISQSPAGDTVHQIWVGTALNQMHFLYAFEGYTVDDQVLEYKPDSPIEKVRFVRILTTKSPSWVSWKEIEVLAP